MASAIGEKVATDVVGAGVQFVLKNVIVTPIKLFINCKNNGTKLEEELNRSKATLKDMESEANKNELGKTLQQELCDAVNAGGKVLERYSKIPCAPCSRIKLSGEAEEAKQRLKTFLSGAKEHMEGAALFKQMRRSKTEVGSSIIPCKKVPKLPDYIVGMDDHCQRLEALLIDSNSMARVGICGEGGHGKTLLTHMLRRSQRIRDYFESRIYTVEIRSEKQVSTETLQEKLYKEMKGEYKKFDTTNSGKDELYTMLQGVRCLIIIDNVWDIADLKCLDVVHEDTGSKILVTTRNSDLLDQFKAYKEFINPLSPEDSWKLFCRHAFGLEYDNISKEMINIARQIFIHFNGLPLALEIVGCAMYRKNLHEWRINLNKVKKGEHSIDVEHASLYKCLKLSYDQLKNNTHQKCFLDLGLCPSYHVKHFFERWKVLKFADDDEDAFTILRTLERYFLISCERADDDPLLSSVKMHDHVRGLATYIMDTEKLSYRLSIVQKGITEFPLQEMNTKQIQLIDLPNNKLESLPEPFTALKLKLLALTDNPLTYIPKGFFNGFPNLKYLGLDRIKCEVPVEDLKGLNNLEVLYLSKEKHDFEKSGCFSCKIQEQKPGLNCLRFAYVGGYCPSFLTSSNLEDLHLSVSHKCLFHLPKSICRSSKLKILSITVQSMKSEEENNDNDKGKYLFYDMNLQNLEYFGLHINVLPWSNVSYISKLNWQAFSKVCRLSLSNLDWSQVAFKFFTKLEELEMHEFQLVEDAYAYYRNLGYGEGNVKWGELRLEKLPEGIAKLPHLKKLNVAMCPLIEIVCEDGDFAQLEQLYVCDEPINVPSELRHGIHVKSIYADYYIDGIEEAKPAKGLEDKFQRLLSGYGYQYNDDPDEFDEDDYQYNNDPDEDDEDDRAKY